MSSCARGASELPWPKIDRAGKDREKVERAASAPPLIDADHFGELLGQGDRIRGRQWEKGGRRGSRERGDGRERQKEELKFTSAAVKGNKLTAAARNSLDKLCKHDADGKEADTREFTRTQNSEGSSVLCGDRMVDGLGRLAWSGLRQSLQR